MPPNACYLSLDCDELAIAFSQKTDVLTHTNAYNTHSITEHQRGYDEPVISTQRVAMETLRQKAQPDE